ncbi:MAG: phosphoribosylformimino-5-aminoimidazole carboxamide ribotide isomerase [Opitutales bacterium]|nr:phosphoribosylformimino-5-aminoimidazole carboxamide ribotide isomerase [Opitutales bacterium]
MKQIVGGSLNDDGACRENFVSQEGAAEFAQRYRADELSGGHVIKLGPGNDEAAREALAAWPGGLQVGGGIRPGNALEWIEAGASHVIVTSCLFDSEGRFLPEALKALADEVGPERLVVDLSCRRKQTGWTVAMNRWQTLTNLDLNHATLDGLGEHCAEFLIHAADVEGLCQGFDRELVALLGEWGKKPLTYAGGVSSMAELEELARLSRGAVDVTIGSALDIFGGNGFKYSELVSWNRR